MAATSWQVALCCHIIHQGASDASRTYRVAIVAGCCFPFGDMESGAVPSYCVSKLHANNIEVADHMHSCQLPCHRVRMRLRIGTRPNEANFASEVHRFWGIDQSERGPESRSEGPAAANSTPPTSTAAAWAEAAEATALPRRLC